MMLRFVTLVLLLLLPAKEAAAMAAEALSPRETGQPTGDRSMKLPASLSSYNAALTVTLHTSTATLTVLDRRTQQSWAQQPFSKDVVLQSAAANAGIEICLKHIPSGLDLKMRLQL